MSPLQIYTVENPNTEFYYCSESRGAQNSVENIKPSSLYKRLLLTNFDCVRFQEAASATSDSDKNILMFTTLKMTVPTKPPSDSTFNIPTVDITTYLNSPTSTEALKIVDQVRTACLTTGFFQLVGHGIPRSVQDDVFRGSEAFFSLPFEEKKKLDKSVSEGASNRGYELIGNQGLQEGTLPDLKEVSILPRLQSSI